MVRDDEQTVNDENELSANNSENIVPVSPKHAASSSLIDLSGDEGQPLSFEGDIFYMVPGDRSSDYQDDQENVPLPYEPSADNPEIAKKSKRLKITLILVLLILLVVIGGLCFWGYTLLFKSDGGGTSLVSGPDNNSLKIKDATDEATSLNLSLPKLTVLFGLTTDEALARLGSSYQLVSTSQAAATSSDETNVAVVDANAAAQIIEIDYKVTTTKATITNAPKIYLSLNASGKVVGCYVTSALNVLGYSPSTFSSLVATGDILNNTLSAIGITPSNFTYTVPSAETYTTYSKDAGGNSTNVIAKESASFDGITADQSVAPKTWSVTLEYDYTLYNITNDSSKLSRMLYIKLV
jgi:hypothetical protein